MPVEPLFSIGPLAQPAPADGNHYPSHDGNARFARSPPPGLFLAGYPESSHRSVNTTLQNLSPNQIYRSQPNLAGLRPHQSSLASDEFAFADSGNPLQSARQEHPQVSQPPGFDLHHQRTMPPEMPRYSTLCAQMPAHANGSQSNPEFCVTKEEFPELPRIDDDDDEFPDESSREGSSPQAPTEAPAEPKTSAEVLMRDKHDLKSFMESFSTKKFCEDYRLLNFEDVIRRSVDMHPTLQCNIKCVTRAHPMKDMLIGVLLANECKHFYEPEDLRTQSFYASEVNGHDVPVLENDKYYAMSDTLKDKLRTPRLQMLDDFTLFFQFYCFTRDTQQLVAADALFQRNWRWNKKTSRWCKFERAHQSTGHQVGVFNVYDPLGCKIRQEIIEYSTQDFELQPPQIPPPKLWTHNNSMNSGEPM